jgi:hypothetical protein
MAAPRGIRRIVELALDKLAAARMRDQAQDALDKATDPRRARANLSRTEAAFDRLKGAALRVGAAIAGAFALDRLIDFGRQSVRIAQEAEAGFSRLTTTLASVGVAMDDQRTRIEGIAEAIQNSTRFDDDAVFEALNRLVGLTKNYEASLGNLPLVADVAAARQISLAEAADIVGKVMVGQTRVLRQFGITAKDADDGIRQLAERMRGQAAADAQTFGGQVAQLSNAWDNFKESIGAALIEAGGGTSILATLTAAVKTATTWVNNNTSTIVEWAKALQTVGGWIAWLATKSAEGWGKIIDWMILAGTRFNVLKAQVEVFALGFGKSIAEAFAEVGRRIVEFTSNLNRLPLGVQAMLGLSNLAGRGMEAWANAFSRHFDEALGGAEARLAQFRREYDAARASLGRDPAGRSTPIGAGAMPSGDPRATAGPSSGSGTRSTWNWRAPFRAPGVARGIDPFVPFDDSALSAQLDATRSKFDTFFLALQVGAVEAGEAISDNLTNAFQRMWEEGATIGGLFNAMFEGIASSATDAIGQMAKSKATENFIRAAEEAAQAVASLFTPGRQAETAGHIKAAGMFAAVGSAWAALAGGAAASNAIRGGGGGGHGGYKADGRRAVDESRVKGPEVHVYIDPLDPFKPAYQDSVYAAESLARERYGDNARVTVHPRRG